MSGFIYHIVTEAEAFLFYLVWFKSSPVLLLWFTEGGRLAS